MIDATSFAALFALLAFLTHPCHAGQFALGEERHRRISAPYWSVTKSDLIDFGRQVWIAMQEDRIRPTPSDDFSSDDMVVGPSIYTVTDQFIKPVTAQAGGMSWALMLHPEGIKCDVFVTHSWQEGVFEFIDKVIASWPGAGKHAWCCMLANPQNLDIGFLLGRVHESPFALALESTNVMIVVPNKAVSLYSRLWCVYEAFLACSWSKYVCIAQRPMSWRRVAPMLVVLVIAFICGSVFGVYHDMDHMFIPDGERLFCAWVASLIRWTWLGRFFNVLGMFAVASHSSFRLAEGKSIRVRAVLHLIVYVSVVFERARKFSNREARRELNKGFCGKSSNAACTEQRDEMRIKDHIGSHFQEIDEYILCLQKAGMFSSALRQASSRGVNIAAMRFNPSSACLMSWGWWFLDNYHFSRNVRVEEAFNLGLFVAWTLVFMCQRRDAQIFSSKVLVTMFILFQLLPFYIWKIILAKQYDLDDEPMYSRVEDWRYICQGILVVAFSSAGLGTLASIPGVGPTLVQFILDFLSLPSCKCRRWSQITTLPTPVQGEMEFNCLSS